MLKRHLGKVHTANKDEATGEEWEGDVKRKKKKLVQRMDIDVITGKTYNSLASSRLNDPTSNVLRCPHPLTPGSTPPLRPPVTKEYVSSRVYDLRRHLKAEHGVTVDKEVVDDKIDVEISELSILPLFIREGSTGTWTKTSIKDALYT